MLDMILKSIWFNKEFKCDCFHVVHRCEEEIPF